ncbi:MAG: hypothetical protein IAG10_05685 [Planctomycetaceae bacterium]|nr:hypothetical protein [Planctomycetaceae bacterium]
MPDGHHSSLLASQQDSKPNDLTACQQARFPARQQADLTANNLVNELA